MNIKLSKEVYQYRSRANGFPLTVSIDTSWNKERHDRYNILFLYIQYFLVTFSNHYRIFAVFNYYYITHVKKSNLLQLL